MNRRSESKTAKQYQRRGSQRVRAQRRNARNSRPSAGYRRRGAHARNSQEFYAQEDWHEPLEDSSVRFVVQKAGAGHVHPVTIRDVRRRLAELPERYTRDLDVVQLSRMTRKRALFPCYGMQWATSVYLYPIETTLVETYVRPPLPQQVIEARMFGGRWEQDGSLWRLRWTRDSIRDFYLNNVLIHEVGHVNDARNTNFDDRERFADWFALEYGYRASRGRR
ncbi:MAG: hypothetical protein CMJ48_07395 [Planctomycetaceae bacterium]|nr:hypothetical protein [Planctomycetaceae bacterium]